MPVNFNNMATLLMNEKEFEQILSFGHNEKVLHSPNYPKTKQHDNPNFHITMQVVKKIPSTKMANNLFTCHGFWCFFFFNQI